MNAARCFAPQGRRSVFFFNQDTGLGDDLMVAWAAAATALLGIGPRPLALCFQRASTRKFLATHMTDIDGLELLDEPAADDFVTYLRPTRSHFAELPLWRIAGLVLKRSSAFGDPYFHKAWREFGSQWSPNWRYRLAVRCGALHAWQPPYPEIYDGCQEIAIALRMSKAGGAALQQQIASKWPELRERLIASVPRTSDPAATLLFPAGGSFQDFDDEVVRELLAQVPEAKIARHVSDERPADLRYERFEEVVPWLGAAAHVITTDSAISHLAQFYSRRHTLVCSRSRPANVVFPGAENTTVIDLGGELPCRPCFYLPLRVGRCPAGYERCAAFRKPLPRIDV